MHLYKFFATGLLLALLLCLSSCGPAVRITGQWQNPDAQPTTDYHQIMVSAMVANEAAKRSIENAFETQLEEENIAATKGHVLFPTMFSDEFEKDKDKMIQKIQETENDAILSISVLDKDTETRYVPGTTGPYRPMASYRWYGDFWNHYNYYYPMVYDSGYYTTTEVYYIETNLYDAQSERLIWSAQTETYNPREMEEFAADLAESIVDEMKSEGFIPPGTTALQEKP